jgi:hypothetical protein
VVEWGRGVYLYRESRVLGEAVVCTTRGALRDETRQTRWLRLCPCHDCAKRTTVGEMKQTQRLKLVGYATMRSACGQRAEVVQQSEARRG